MALGSELYCVSQKINDNLSKPGHITNDCIDQWTLVEEGKVQIVDRSQLADDLNGAFNTIVQRKWSIFKREGTML